MNSFKYHSCEISPDVWRDWNSVRLRRITAKERYNRNRACWSKSMVIFKLGSQVKAHPLAHPTLLFLSPYIAFYFPEVISCSNFSFLLSEQPTVGFH
jgi:hypothetical protein